MKMTALSMATGCIAREAVRVSKPKFEVVVGNIGTVYSGNNNKQALKDYKFYVNESDIPFGRASGESVTMFKNGETFKEFIGKIEMQEYID
jgi:hypothetical protein